MVPVSVLLVEDNEDILANLYAYLEPLGYELDCARNGRTGLEMAASGQFDLVVLDIMLPGLDGISLCRALREEHGVQVPVIMLTARDTVADRVLGLDAGADDYLVKPLPCASWRPASGPCCVGAGRRRAPRAASCVWTMSVSTWPGTGSRGRAARSR